jgi:phage terminase small subunit
MAKRLSKKEKEFIEEYAKTGNGTRSALKAYDTTSENVASVIAHENIRKPRIWNAIQDMCVDAKDTMQELCKQRKNLNVAYSASKDILDRGGYKPKEDKVDPNVTINIVSFNA